MGFLLQKTHNVPNDDVENTNGTNWGGDTLVNVFFRRAKGDEKKSRYDVD